MQNDYSDRLILFFFFFFSILTMIACIWSIKSASQASRYHKRSHAKLNLKRKHTSLSIPLERSSFNCANKYSCHSNMPTVAYESFECVSIKRDINAYKYRANINVTCISSVKYRSNILIFFINGY